VSSFNLLMASGGALIEQEKLSADIRSRSTKSHRELYEQSRSRDPEPCAARHGVSRDGDARLAPGNLTPQDGK